MTVSRRDLSFLFPALLAGAGSAQSRKGLSTSIYHHSQTPYSGDDKKRGRAFFQGATHSGFGLEMHETILGRDVETHAPHKHEHEEIVIIVEGSVEAFIEGRTELAETGSVIYFGSNQMHSVRNAGQMPCRYYVVELRGAGA